MLIRNSINYKMENLINCISKLNEARSCENFIENSKEILLNI